MKRRNTDPRPCWNCNGNADFHNRLPGNRVCSCTVPGEPKCSGCRETAEARKGKGK